MEIDFSKYFVEDYLKISQKNKISDEVVGELIKKSVRQSIKSSSNKKPEVQFHILRK